MSISGKGEGFDEGSGTRSGLLWECKKIIEVKKPKFLLLENVKPLVGKKHQLNFNRWCNWLENQGYTNYWKILNAKDYGVPQNRERVFMISVLNT
ncbi:DNA cytosine methyltransferase [Enterococcus termitis]